MRQSINKKPSSRIIIVIVSIFLLFSGIIASLGYYYQKNGKVAGDTDISSQTKILIEYQNEFNNIFKGYLILSTSDNVLDDNFYSKTVSIKERLLEMKVPAELKESHLNSVLSLIEIENGIIAQDIDLVVSNIDKLRKIMNNI